MIIAAGLLVLGVVVIIIEFFVPSFGLIGAVGIASIIGSIVTAYRVSAAAGTAFLIASVIIVPVLMILFFRIFPSSFIGKRLILGRRFDPEEGFSSFDDKAGEQLVGKNGVSLTDLRPAGTANIDNRKISVVTSGEYIEKGVPVVVSAVEGSRIIVKKE